MAKVKNKIITEQPEETFNAEEASVETTVNPVTEEIMTPETTESINTVEEEIEQKPKTKAPKKTVKPAKQNRKSQSLADFLF